jgi:hypothetical protein
MPVDSAGRPVVRPKQIIEAKRPNVAEGLPRDRLTANDSTGLTLKAAFHWADIPTRPTLPHANASAIAKAAEQTMLDVSIDLAYAGRMRLSIESPIFPIPAKTELRARSDFFGHALIWPNGVSYRLLAPGSVRALLAERRPDVVPVMRGESQPAGSATLLGLAATKTRIVTKLGEATIAQATLEGSGPAGKLLCRFLLDFIAVDPATDTCTDDRVPVEAQYKWKQGGRLSFSVETLENRQDLPLQLVVVPPPGAAFRPGELPSPAAGVFLTREQLAGFRKQPLSEEPAEGAPGEGLLVVNHTDTLRYVLLDGVPVAWVEPHKEQYLIGTKPGRYSIGWRDFLGKALTPPQTVSLPARVELGERADSGAQ